MIKNTHTVLRNRIVKYASKYCRIVNILTDTPKNDLEKIALEIKDTTDHQYSALAYPHKIVLLIPGHIDKKMCEELSAIIVHEYFHVCIESNDKLKKVIETCLKNNISFIKSLKIKKLTPWIVLNELIVSSFVPEGYLGQLMGYDIHYKETTTIGKIRLKIGRIMSNTAKKYILNRMLIDESYITTIIKKLKTSYGLS